MWPFADFMVLLSFDLLAAYLLLYGINLHNQSFENRKIKGLSIDLQFIIASLIIFSILSRLQLWSYGLIAVHTAFFFYLLMLYMFIRQHGISKLTFTKVLADKITRTKLLLNLFIGILLSACLFTNDLQFHHLFSGNSYEEHVRARYRFDEAMKLLQLNKSGSTAALKKSARFFDRATKELENGAYEKAEKYFSLSIDFNPDNMESYYQRGLIRHHKLEISELNQENAYYDFVRTTQIDSTFAVGYLYRAVTYSYLFPKDTASLLNNLKTAVRMDSSLAENQYVISVFRNFNQ